MWPTEAQSIMSINSPRLNKYLLPSFLSQPEVDLGSLIRPKERDATRGGERTGFFLAALNGVSAFKCTISSGCRVFRTVRALLSINFSA